MFACFGRQESKCTLNQFSVAARVLHKSVKCIPVRPNKSKRSRVTNDVQKRATTLQAKLMNGDYCQLCNRVKIRFSKKNAPNKARALFDSVTRFISYGDQVFIKKTSLLFNVAGLAACHRHYSEPLSFKAWNSGRRYASVEWKKAI